MLVEGESRDDFARRAHRLPREIGVWRGRRCGRGGRLRSTGSRGSPDRVRSRSRQRGNDQFLAQFGVEDGFGIAFIEAAGRFSTVP